MPRGRQPKIASPAIRSAVIESLRKGVGRTDAAQLALIDPGTLTRWLKRGEDPEAGTVYRDFRRDVLKAELKAKVDCLSAIHQAANSDDPSAWKAAAWYLERRYPEEWGRRDRLRVDGTLQASVQVTDEIEAALEDPEVREMLDALALRAGSLTTTTNGSSSSNRNGSANGNGSG